MKIKEQIANFFTLMNLVCGVIAIVSIINQNLSLACLLVFLGALFDFADGFIARALGISSELGKQLDSLSDVVTFGVVPGLIAYTLLVFSLGGRNPFVVYNYGSFPPPLTLVAVFIPAFSALRLAKFNIDTKQSKNFIGLPTPANGLLWASFGLIIAGGRQVSLLGAASPEIGDSIRGALSETTFLVSAVVLLSFLLVAPINLMGLKFDKFTWQGNEMKFLLILVSAALLILLGFAAVPIILLLYILFSIIHFYILKRI